MRNRATGTCKPRKPHLLLCRVEKCNWRKPHGRMMTLFFVLWAPPCLPSIWQARALDGVTTWRTDGLTDKSIVGVGGWSCSLILDLIVNANFTEYIPPEFEISQFLGQVKSLGQRNLLKNNIKPAWQLRSCQSFSTVNNLEKFKIFQICSFCCPARFLC